MFRAPRVVSPVMLVNTAGVLASALAAVVGLYVATPNVTQPNAEPNTPPTSSLPRSTPTPPGRKASAVPIAGGPLHFAPSDWESVDKVKPIDAVVGPFWLDRYEVTYDDWAKCSTCTPLNAIDDPHTPVVNVSPHQARVFCQYAKGRLPTRPEWVLAASTPNNYRYPWGQTGLVCRTAVFGTVNGPCAFGQSAQHPGSRPAGATQTGIFDLAGNVAEWANEGDGYVALGGSFRSTLAGQLKVWSLEETQQPRDDIGFRCAYDMNE